MPTELRARLGLAVAIFALVVAVLVLAWVYENCGEYTP